jgi:GT2 family glycosyltransferase
MKRATLAGSDSTPSLDYHEPEAVRATMASPKVSIVTTVHNGERYLDEAIESVIRQDFTDFEYIIVDDGSVDTSVQILHRWAQRDARIVIECLPENVGIARAFNHGLKQAQGQYICRHDADDIYVGPRLRHQVEQLDADPNVALVTANCVDINAVGDQIDEHIVQAPPEVIAFLLNFSNCIMGAGGQGMFRTSVARELGGFCENLQASVDYDFFCRLSKRGCFTVIPFVGLKRRVHAQQISRRWRHIQIRNSMLISKRMLSEYLGRTLSDEEAAEIASVCGQLGSANSGGTAQHVLREAFSLFAGGKRQRVLVRRVIAHWWVHSAAALFKRRKLAEAVCHLRYAFLWHPSSILMCVKIVLRKMLGVRRPTQSDQHQAG